MIICIKKIPLIFFLSICFFKVSYSQINNYKWETISGVNNAQDISVDNDGNFWIGTTGGLLKYFPKQDSFKLYKLEDGLIALNVTSVGVDKKSGNIFTGSSDGKMSILKKDGSWIYSTEIYLSTEYPDRSINGFGFNDGKAYVLTGFGVGVYDITKNAFIDSYRFLGSIPRNTAVNEIYFSNDKIYLATNAGIVFADKSLLNLASPTSWITLNKLNSGILSDTVYSINEYNGKIIVGTRSGVCLLNDKLGFDTVQNNRSEKALFFKNQNRLYIGFSYVFPVFELFEMSSNGLISIGGATDILQTLFVNENGGIFVGLKRKGFSSFNISNQNTIQISPNTPTSNLFSGFVKSSNGDLWTIHGGRGFGDGFSLLRNGVWTQFRVDINNNIPANDIWNIGGGVDNSIWCGIYGKGFINIEPKSDSFKYKIYDKTNTPMRGVGTGGSYEVGAQTVTDSKGRTWFVSYSPGTNSGSILFSKDKNDSVCISAITPIGLNGDFRWITIDQSNTKWLGSDETGDARGLVYFNDNNTPYDPSDDITGRITTFDGLIDNTIKYLVSDKDGILWIGTSKGLTALYNPTSTVMDKSQPSFQNFRPLNDVTIRSISIDVLNRKWVGTDKGLYIINADGSEVIKQFSSENSPLVSDKVISLLCDEKSGDVFVGTDNGMNRIKTDAVKSDAISELSFNPNPFIIPDNDGVTIQGLPSLANVKILTLSGGLIKEFVSPGGSVASWDGKNSNGVYVKTGIYIVVGSSISGDETILGKLTVISK
jgi:ligand-binding sensor domain-containing protein